MWNLKIDFFKAFSDAKSNLVVARGGLMWAKWMKVVKRCKLPALKLMS